MKELIVKDININVATINEQDFICIKDMLKAKDSNFFITDRLRN